MGWKLLIRARRVNQPKHDVAPIHTITLDRLPRSRFTFDMTDPLPDTVPPSLARTLRQFRTLDRDDKMQALLSWSRRLEPLPERLAVLDRAAFTVPECQTRVDLFPERRDDGTLHFYADVNARQSPTVAAVLAIVFSAVNDQSPSVTLSLPSDVVRLLMQDIGLGARESGLNAMIQRLQKHARDFMGGSTPGSSPHS